MVAGLFLFLSADSGSPGIKLKSTRASAALPILSSLVRSTIERLEKERFSFLKKNGQSTGVKALAVVVYCFAILQSCQ